ncbi:MAG TPA: hypothetical protein DDZ88_23380 [Verrucomicrobiales bacterium]|nr:hypothetical protein [Verrucomicrobiales bacterium]
MPPLRSCTCLAALLLLAGQARATVGESGVFSFDTRDSVSTVVGESGVFAFDTRLVDGLGDDGNSGTFVLDTLGASVSTLTIAGPPVVLPGARAQFVVMAQYANGTLADVTSRCQWQTSALPEGATFSWGVLTTTARTPGGTFQLSASYMRDDGRQMSGVYSVTVSAATWCKLSAAQATPLAGSNPAAWSVAASVAAAPDLVPPLTYQWFIGANAVGTNSPVLALSSYSGVAPGLHTVSVHVTDANSRMAADGKLVVFNKPSVPAEPVTTKETKDLVATSFKDRLGNDFTFDLNRVANGFVVIAHGWNDNSEGWAQEMAYEIEQRMGGAAYAPNILLFDWREAADVNNLNEDVLLGMAAEMKRREPELARVLTAAAATDLLAELLSIRGIGFSQGQKLGAALLPQFTATQPLISRAAPIHFIGHSAGGFVVGEAAKVISDLHKGPSGLTPFGFQVGMVTMLDTPEPYITHFRPAAAGVVERYISSIFGSYAPSFELSANRGSNLVGPVFAFSELRKKLDLVPSSTYRLESAPDWPANPLDGHSWGHEWYIDTVKDEAESGFNHSPLLAPASPPMAAMMQSAESSFSSEAEASAPPPAAISTAGFTPFGNATITATGFDISESANAGVFQNMTLPVGADVLHFEFQFTAAGDGDFLSVQFADRPPLFIGSDTEMARAHWIEVDIPIRELQAATGDLMFALISRGTANAAISIRNLSLTIHPDPDFDDLTTEQEAILGTNPMLADTDGDLIDDLAELNGLPPTDPVLADTDADGVLDGAELDAGTDPTNGQSYLRVTDAIKNTGSTFLLRWPSQAGRFYNVQRSTDVTFATYEVIGQGQTATPPLNTHVDNAAGAAQRMFYRIEVYQP